MAPRYVEASTALLAFSCPRCGALADQRWFILHADIIEKGKLPAFTTIESRDKFLKELRATPGIPDWRITEMERIDNLEIAGDIRFNAEESIRGPAIANLHVSKCFSCNDITLWRRDTVMYPPTRFGEEPNQDVPDDIKLDFEEARTLLELSPRGSSALLRLCVQKLCKHLGSSEDNLNQAIGELVAKGLPLEVKMALDVVRVIGNDAVHPGQMDLRDNRDVASQLFTLVNLIASRMISEPKALEKLHDMIPEDKIKQIESRDQKAKVSK